MNRQRENEERGPSVRRFASASAMNLGMQIASQGATLLTSVVLGRTLGASALGEYAFVYSLLRVLSMVARLGFENLLVREVAGARERGDWGLIKGLLRFAELSALGASVSAGLIAYAIASWFASAATAHAMAAGAVLLVPMTVINVRSGALRGLHAVVVAQVSVLVTRPLAFLAFVGALAFTGHVTAEAAVLAHGVAYALAWLLAVRSWSRLCPPQVRAARATMEPRRWLRASLALLVLGGLAIVNSEADVLFMKVLSDEAATGVYSVVVQLGRFPSLILSVVNAVIASRFAALHERGDKKGLEQLVTTSTALVSALTVPAVLVFAVLGRWVLRIYGEEFIAGYMPLLVVVVGHLVSALAGSVGLLLIMTGHERDVGVASGTSIVINVALLAVLIPPFGMVGAALASACAQIYWNLLLARRVRTLLGIESTALGWLKLRLGRH